MIVEIDESKFGKRKYHKGYHVEGVWILGMIEREDTKKIKLIRVSNRSKDELNQLIKKSVKKDTVIYTDCWKGYSGLNVYFSDHKTVNHSKHFKDPITQVHTNTIEGSWAAIKAQTSIRGRTEKTIDLYLVRYMLLKNETDHLLKCLIKYSFYLIFEF